MRAASTGPTSVVTHRVFGNLAFAPISLSGETATRSCRSFAGYDTGARPCKLRGMALTTWTRTTAVVFLLSASLAPAAAPDPLFAGTDSVEIRIAAALTTLMRERPDDEELDGELSYLDDAGNRVSLGVELRTRGNYRRQERTCPFAPLRLDVRKSEVEGTLFDGQDKLKLVTHCRNALRYEQAVIREYVTYRMFNTLTDLSYRVRPLTVTYVDTERGNRENTRFGFVIENKERFAARVGLEVLEQEAGHVGSLDPAYASLVAMFQYFAGNTDYSLIRGARDDDCCHNANLLVDGSGTVFAVPYDFDMSGLVDARYATPNPALNLRSNRERLYRGHCAYNDHIDASVDRFLRLRADLYGLIDAQADLTAASRKGMTRSISAGSSTIWMTRVVSSSTILRVCSSFASAR